MGSLHQENVKNLEMVQRRSARYVLNRYNYLSSVNEMLQKLKWDTLEEKRRKDKLVMLYKIHKDQTVIDTARKCLKPLGQISRHANNQAYEVPFALTDYYKFSFFPRTIRAEWNALATRHWMPPLWRHSQTIFNFIYNIIWLLYFDRWPISFARIINSWWRQINDR